MKRRSKENIDTEQQNAHIERGRARRKAVIESIGILAAGTGLAAGLVTGMYAGVDALKKHSDRQSQSASQPTPEHTGATGKADAAYREALEKELKSAFEGPVEIDQAENTHKTTTKFGDKRGIINIHIDGSAKNTETAESTGTPDYYYEDTPEAHLVSIDGKKIRAGAIARWKSTQEDGDVILYPRLANFASSTPKTLDYKMEVAAEGYVPDGLNLKAEYDAGDLLVTGSNGKITSIDAVPASNREPEITEN